jgi:hypothetical protein
MRVLLAQTGVTTSEPGLILLALPLVWMLAFSVYFAMGLFASPPAARHRRGIRPAARFAGDRVAWLIVPSLLCLLACMVVCALLLIAVVAIGGLLVLIGVMSPVASVMSPALLTVMTIIHLVGQIYVCYLSWRMSPRKA